jgi:DNA-binding NarL/FixJ family response regulator
MIVDPAKPPGNGLAPQQPHIEVRPGRVLIATEDPLARKHWQHSLAGDAYRVDGVGSWLESLEFLGRHPVDVLVLDSRWLGAEMAATLGTIANTQAACRILVVGREWPERHQVVALSLGARGYCEYAADPASCRGAVASIIVGGAWISRTLIPKIIDYVRSGAIGEPGLSAERRQIQERLELLSPREWEVVRLISVGNGNKAVARTLRITERTVKAHLTSIFRKLGVEDRMHLALLYKEAEQSGLVASGAGGGPHVANLVLKLWLGVYNRYTLWYIPAVSAREACNKRVQMELQKQPTTLAS